MSDNSNNSNNNDNNSNSNSNNPQAGQGRPLPRKESDLFRNVVKHYESKHYKKGMKCADTILKRFPNHGETLCMKGLIVNAVARNDAASAMMSRGGEKKGENNKDNKEDDGKAEAVDLVKRGLMMDMRSHVCWHVYGLLHRSSQDYAEAVKAYKQALRIDPENLQILRDMGLLQIQMRDVGGFRDTRLKILTLRPGSRVHWLSYALGCHVDGDARGAAGVLDSYLGTLEADSVEFKRGFESSELAMYKNMVTSEIGGGDDGLDGVRKALDHLDEIKRVVVDITGWIEAKLDYQLRLGTFDDARETALSLLERGSTEDHRVHGAYMCALLKCDRETCAEVGRMTGTGTLATLGPLDDDGRATLLGAYEEGGDLATRFPRSAAVKRIRLTLLPPDGDGFRATVDAHCRRQILKGVPSLGSDLSALYLMEKKPKTGENGGSKPPAGRYVLGTDPADVGTHPIHKLLAELADSYISSLSADGAFPGGDGGTSAANADFNSPSALLWSWHLRAVLHEQAGEYAAGMALVDKCIEHTPTGVDFYELRARLLELGGDVRGAAEAVDAGRDLDHQDRYINNQATKTLLRAGREMDARNRIAMFTRHEGNPEHNLYDMQCTWYELELADCWRRAGELGRALRKYMAVIKHYEDFHEDQFDFHMYCIRKVTLRSYCRLLRFEDELWGLPHYGRAAEGAIGLHLRLADDPSLTAAAGGDGAEPDYSGMTPAERKKAKNIARKKAKKRAAAAAGGGGGGKGGDPKNAQDNGGGGGNNKKKKGKPHVVDEDPEGKELLAADHLGEARKYASILVRHAPKRMSAWALHYDVSARRGKMLMALQALCRMKSIDPDDHRLFSRVVDFSRRLSSRTAEQGRGHAASERVISEEFPALMDGDGSLGDFIRRAADDVGADPSSSLPRRVAVARAVLLTEAGSAADATSLILDSKLVGARCVTVEACREALEFVRSLGEGGGEYEERLRSLIMDRFPFAKDFC